MNCRKVQSQLSAFADGELTGAQMLVLNRHLSACATCQRELDQMIEIKNAIGQMATMEPSDAFKVRLREAVCAEASRAPKGRPVIGFFATALAAAVVMFAFLQVGRLQTNPAGTPVSNAAPQVNLVQDQAVMGADDPFSTTSPIFLASSRGE